MLSAKAQAHRLLQGHDWWVLDCETTGLGNAAEPVEIALVSGDGQLRWSRLLRPTRPVESEASLVHGLDTDHLAGAPEFVEVYPVLAELLRRRTAIAYHADFDRFILDSACRRISQPLFSCRWQCALDLYELWRGFRPTLSIACEIEGIPLGATHRAGPDALLLWKLLSRMAGR
ncbi:MAG TPA: 3'-5' exonuclease [Acidobacteriota bacterium]|nr:3'-5' exonuclease [Acidobacteriota bacterium]